MKTFLTCYPLYYGVHYSINPWMNVWNSVDRELAFAQWSDYIDLLSFYADVEIMSPARNLPDMVFTANAGMVESGRIYISKFKCNERQGESVHFEKYFRNNFPSEDVNVATVSMEGNADIMFDDINIFMATGNRTDAEFKTVLEQEFSRNIYLLELINPRFYHLDTCFNILTDGTLMYYPKAFSNQSEEIIRSVFDKIIEVSDEDATLFACNSVCIGEKLIIPGMTKDLKKTLYSYGYDPIEVNLSEFMKAGGAAKCLTLDISSLYS